MELLMIRRDGEPAIHLVTAAVAQALVRRPGYAAVDVIDSDICPECLYRLRLVEAQGARR